MLKKSDRLIFVFVILIILSGLISYFRVFDRYELALLDLRFQARLPQKTDPQIAIIEIANDTLKNMHSWPLPRDYHATIIQILSQCGVRAIIFDILLSEPTGDDAILAESVKRAGCVYLPYALRPEQIKDGVWEAQDFDTTLLPELAKVAQGTGHANVLTDIDGKRRRIPLLIKYQDDFLPQLSLRAAQGYLNIPAEKIKFSAGKFVQLGDYCRIPIDNEGSTVVSLSGRWVDTFTHYSYYDLFIDYAQGLLGKSGLALSPRLASLKNKVCFVGLTATGTADISASALEAKYPLIGLHANLFNSIISKNFIRRISPLANLVTLYLLCLLNLLLAFKAKAPLNILYRIGLFLLFVLGGFLLFIFSGIWIDLFCPAVIYLLLYLGINVWRYLKEIRQREILEKELDIARNIQRSFLKDVPKEAKAAELAVAMDTARHVGGDLYDFVQFGDGRVGLLVGDVSGKGVPAALFMAQIISRFRYFAQDYFSPAETLTKLNEDVVRDSTSGLFVTMAYLIYDPAKREITLASAGHLPPLVVRDLQLFEKIEVSEGMPLGLMAEAVFEEKQLKLQPKDLVLLYTDGVTEARNSQGAEFGEERLIQALTGKQGVSSKQAVELLRSQIQAFSVRTPQHDDITIMALLVT
ncbi:MAG: SpoIIE family protein phosphatase [Candidatus Omnitrophica bacterium]|nr:SpoIIE family protein phosphatase [Candidatus Omnitrophota bacterium]